MKKEDYRKMIIRLVNENKSLEWLKAIYSFAKNYPDKNEEKE